MMHWLQQMAKIGHALSHQRWPHCVNKQVSQWPHWPFLSTQNLSHLGPTQSWTKTKQCYSLVLVSQLRPPHLYGWHTLQPCFATLDECQLAVFVTQLVWLGSIRGGRRSCSRNKERSKWKWPSQVTTMLLLADWILGFIVLMVWRVWYQACPHHTGVLSD